MPSTRRRAQRLISTHSQSRRQKEKGGEGYAPDALPLGKKPVLIVQEGGCASILVWIRPEKSPSAVLGPRPYPASSQSLYCLRYAVRSLRNSLLVTSLSLQKLWFDTRSVIVGFVVSKVAHKQVYNRGPLSNLPVSFHQFCTFIFLSPISTLRSLIN